MDAPNSGVRFFNRYFFAGLGIGVVLGVVVVLVGLFAFAMFAMNSMRSMQDVASVLPSPDYPDHGQLPVYGEVDPTWAVQDEDGKRVSLGDLQGSVVFLNFWATWCGPCVAEMPNIRNLAQSLDGEEVAFLLVSNEEPATVQQFVESREFDLPVFFSAGELPELFRSPGIPTTYIIDRDGFVIFRHVGGARWDDEASLSFIRGLL